MAMYIARGPISLPGIEQRSGDTFEADPSVIASAVADGLAELVEPLVAGKTGKTGKTTPASDEAE